MPELTGDQVVAALLDTLTDIEREREAFGAVGGVDPVFVALTAKAAAVGRAIQLAAEERRARGRVELERLRPPRLPPPIVISLVDTSPIIQRRDAAVALLDSTARRLAEIRRENAEIEGRAERARAAANIAIPPLGMLAAALVLAGVVGFATALAMEMQNPRIADSNEAEEATGLRVLSVVAPRQQQPERSRRQADRETSPLLDASSDAYRLLYLHVAGGVPRVSLITVTGDDSGVSAVVASNIAAAASYDARTTLLVDADLSACAVASLLRIRTEPGLAEVLAGRLDWTEAIIPATIGRDRTLDVIPGGSCGEPPHGFDAEPTRHSLARLARRYDLVVLVVPPRNIRRGDSILPAPDLILCAQVGRTTVDGLCRSVEALRGAGARIRGLVLWVAEAPAIRATPAATSPSKSDASLPLSAGGAPR